MSHLLFMPGSFATQGLLVPISSSYLSTYEVKSKALGRGEGGGGGEVGHYPNKGQELNLGP